MKIKNTNLKVLQLTEIKQSGLRNVPLDELDWGLNDPNYLLVTRVVRDQEWTKVKGTKYVDKQIVTTTWVEGTDTIYIVLAEVI